MPKKNHSHTHPLPGMTAEEWDKIRVSKSHAELKAMGCVTETQVDCCPGDGTGCPDHDPDAIKIRQIRDKALNGKLSAAEVQDHNEAEIRLKAKGMM